MEIPSTTKASEALKRHRNASPVPVHLQRYIECFLETFIFKGRLDPRLRELSILRIAWRAHQPYEWAIHYRIARSVGVKDKDAMAARLPSAERNLDDAATFTLDAVDEIIDCGMLTPQHFERAQQVFGEADIAEEFIHMVGGYRSMAVLLNTKKPSLEVAGLPFWPPDGVPPVADRTASIKST